MNMTHVTVEVSDLRIFQHLVLLLDRPEVTDKISLIRLTSIVAPLDSLVSKYTQIPDKIYDEALKLLHDYRYPEELKQAILATVLRDKITDEDVAKYTPQVYPRQGIIRDYLHPILSIPVQDHIKRDREWYWLNRDRAGYNNLAKTNGEYKTTVESAIKSYKTKLKIKI